MKIAILSDIHLGNFATGARSVDDARGLNSRGRRTVEVLRGACKKALDLGAELVVWNGDVFHTKRPEPQLLAYAAEIAQEVSRHPRARLIVNRGNHDIIGDVDGADSLGVLSDATEIVTRPRLFGDILFVPYEHPTAERPALAIIREAIVEKLHDASPEDRARTVVVAHLGLSDGASWQSMAHDFCDPVSVAAMALEFGVRAVVHGHGHAPISLGPFPGGPEFVGQVGALCPTGHSEDGVVGGFLFVTPRGFERHAADGSPVFGTARSVAEVDALLASLPPRGALFLRSPADVAEGARERPGVEHVAIEPSAPPIAPAGGAAERLGAGGVVDVIAALGGYVEACELPAAVDRAVVLARVRRRVEGLI